MNLMEQYIKADLHSHLSTLEPKYSFRKLVQAMERRGVNNGLQGITEMSQVGHDTRYSDMKERAKKEGYKLTDLGNAFYSEDGKTFVHGIEIPTSAGHFLAVGAKEGIRIAEGTSPEDSVKEVCDKCGYRPVFIIPHSFSRDGMAEYLIKNPSFLEEVDAIEVWNGSTVIPIINGCFSSSTPNRKAQEFFEEYSNEKDIGAVASSDGHSLEEVFSSYTILTSPNLSDDGTFAESLAGSVRESMGAGIRHSSYFGTMDHAAKMVGAIALGKLGFEI